MIPDYPRKRQRVIEALRAEWKLAQSSGSGALNSEVVYKRLLSEGEVIEKGEMNAILTALRMTRLINGLRSQERKDLEAIERHGGMVITGVAPGLCQS
jgi:predicted DNA-binding transcriptional regulator